MTDDEIAQRVKIIRKPTHLFDDGLTSEEPIMTEAPSPSQRAREILAAEVSVFPQTWIDPALRAIDEAIAQGRADERRAVVADLRSWRAATQDGSVALQIAAARIERGDHTGGKDNG